MNPYVALLIAIVLLLQMPCAGIAQDDQVVNKIIAIAKTDNQTMNHVDVLSNRIGGRLIGSDAYHSATVWSAEMFKRWGLEVEIQEVGEVPVGFNRGPWFGKMMDDDGMVLHFATPSFTAGTKGRQRGHVIAEPKTKAEFENVKGKLKGAWVLISGSNTGAIDFSTVGNEKRKAIIEENEKKRTKEAEDTPALFYKEMVEAGILGVIQSSPVPIKALSARKEARAEMDFYENLPTCPDIKLNENQYKIIAQKVKERRYFQLEFEIRNHFKPGPVKYHNVIGMIRGSEFPDEYVIVGGHLDAYDVATGANDCGSGVAPTLEVARLIMAAGGKPKRTILFCLWAGEEFGLLGSKYWVEQNKDKWSKISNYFNRDGGPIVANSLTVPPAMYDDFVKITAQLNDINPELPFVLNKRTGNPPPATASGSDHASFIVKKLPAITFGKGDPKGYDYRFSDIWHTERDTYDMSIAEYMDHTSVVTAIVVYRTAMLDHLLSRKDLYKN